MSKNLKSSADLVKVKLAEVKVPARVEHFTLGRTPTTFQTAHIESMGNPKRLLGLGYKIFSVRIAYPIEHEKDGDVTFVLTKPDRKERKLKPEQDELHHCYGCNLYDC